MNRPRSRSKRATHRHPRRGSPDRRACQRPCRSNEARDQPGDVWRLAIADGAVTVLLFIIAVVVVAAITLAALVWVISRLRSAMLEIHWRLCLRSNRCGLGRNGFEPTPGQGRARTGTASPRRGPSLTTGAKRSGVIPRSRMMIRPELIESDRCTAASLTVRAYAPVLTMCHALIEAGHAPDHPLHAYRGETLALTVSSIGWGAQHTVMDDRLGKPILRRWKDSRGGAPDAGGWRNSSWLGLS